MLSISSLCEPRLEFEFTQEQGCSTSALLCIAPEILELIIAHMSRWDLKSLRSTCSQFSAFIDPILFHTIVLVPCPASFNIIIALPHPDRISCHVRRLVYDDRWPDVASSIENCLQRVNIGSFNPIANARLLQKLHRLSYFARRFKEDALCEVASLKRIIGALPLFRGVSVFSTHEHDNSAKLPSFYARICSDVLYKLDEASLLPNQPQHSQSGRSALLAIGQSGKNITDINMNGHSWRYMFASHSQLGVLQPGVLANVRNLQLSFAHTQDHLLLRGKFLLAKLGGALSQAIHLQVLRLDFGDDTAQVNVEDDERNSEDSEDVEDIDGRSWCMLSALFTSEDRFPNLKELNLQNFRFSESGLLAFLERHASTLGSLRLNSVELVAPRLSRSPCWRSVFVYLQQALSLCQVQLQDGLYISGGGVTLSMHPKPEERFPGCLLDQVEQFILYGGECPIRLGYHALNGNDLNGLGDESWAFY